MEIADDLVRRAMILERIDADALVR